MDISILRDDVSIIIILGVFTFYMLQKASNQTLLAMLVMGIFGFVSYKYLEKQYIDKKQEEEKTFTALDSEGSKRKEIVSNNFPIYKFPKKGFIYLKQNETFVEIAKDLIIVRMFDKARYSDILLYLNELQKTYMYILDKRYKCKTHVPIFLDLREKILEIMHSLIFVLPERLKHVYGVNPYDVINDNIRKFTVISRTMIDILKSYCKKEAKDPYFPETLPSNSDLPFDYLQQRKLP